MRNFAHSYGDGNPLYCDPALRGDDPLGRPDRAADDDLPAERPVARRQAGPAVQGRQLPRHPRLRVGRELGVVPAGARRRHHLQLQGPRVGRGEAVGVRRPLDHPGPPVREGEPARRGRRRAPDDRHQQRAQGRSRAGQVPRRAGAGLDRRRHRRARRDLRGGAPPGRATLGGGRTSRSGTSSARW